MPPPRIAASSAARCLRPTMPFTTRQTLLQHLLRPSQPTPLTHYALPPLRAFTTTSPSHNWLAPKAGESRKSRKGRPRVPTGGSMRGTTLVWGDYGIRMIDHHRRISAQQLKIAEETIRKRLRGMKYRLYTRVSANIGVYTKGNEVRMGKGKGSFDYWASRVAVSKVIFELQGEVHEQVVRDAFRLAGNKMPGLYEFVKKGDPPVMGITKLDPANGITEEFLKRPRKVLPAPNKLETSGRLLYNPVGMNDNTPMLGSASNL